MDKIPARTTWGELSLAEVKQSLAVAEARAENISSTMSEDEQIRIEAERDELWLRQRMLQMKKSAKFHPSALLA